MKTDYIQKLEDIAHAAWHALEDSCDDGENISIERTDYDALCMALWTLCDDSNGDIHDFIGRSYER